MAHGHKYTPTLAQILTFAPFVESDLDGLTHVFINSKLKRSSPKQKSTRHTI